MPMFWLTQYTPEQATRLQEIEKALVEVFPEPPHFTDLEQIENLTMDQALAVIQAARRKLVMDLLALENHEHWLDDCGDYTQAATENWHYLHNLYWMNDLQTEEVLVGVKLFLDPRERLNENDPIPIGGSDGEIRFDLLSEELMEIGYGD